MLIFLVNNEDISFSCIGFDTKIPEGVNRANIGAFSPLGRSMTISVDLYHLP